MNIEGRLNKAIINFNTASIQNLKAHIIRKDGSKTIKYFN